MSDKYHKNIQGTLKIGDLSSFQKNQLYHNISFEHPKFDINQLHDGYLINITQEASERAMYLLNNKKWSAIANQYDNKRYLTLLPPNPDIRRGWGSRYIGIFIYDTFVSIPEYALMGNTGLSLYNNDKPLCVIL